MPYQQKRVPIGQRRERVEVQRARTTDDGAGGQVVTKWTPIASLWAQVVPLDERTKEAFAARQITALHAYHIVIPYSTEVTPAERVVWRGQTLQIHTVTDDESRRRRLVLQCGEVQGEAT
jgi:SPP1 family predicted phage head-tail adaptor